MFRATVSGTKSFAGRQVFEASNGAATDTCWFPDAAQDGFQPAGLTGGGWFVGYYFFNNQWHYDYVGFTNGAVEYYQDHSRVPCAVNIPQAMKIYRNDGASSQTYFTNWLRIRLENFFYVGVARTEQWGWRQWPQP
jgi:hypothetical protein